MQMDFTTVINAISNVGFPITLAVVFGYLIWRLGKKINDTAEKNMAELQFLKGVLTETSYVSM